MTQPEPLGVTEQVRLAQVRTLLANERTLLAFLRSGLAFGVAGASFYNFFDVPVIRASGLALIPAGFLVFGVGVIRYLQIRRDVRRSRTSLVEEDDERAD